MGDVSFTSTANATFASGAFYANSTAYGHAKAPVLVVHVFSRQSATLGAGVLSPKNVQISPVHEDSYLLHDANLTFVPGAALGFLGAYLDPTGQASLSTTGSTATPTTSSAIPKGTQGTDAPNLPYYRVQNDQPHFDITGKGSFAYSGVGALKFVGSHLTIISRENVTEIDTGTLRSGPATEQTTWAYLELIEPATFEAHSTDSFQVSTSSEATFTAAQIEFTPTRGALEGAGERYAPRPGLVELAAGRFAGSLSTADGQSAQLLLRGDLDATTLGMQHVPTGALGSAPFWRWFVAGSTVLACGVGGAFAWRSRLRRTRGDRFGECMREAELADRARDSVRALAWLDKALRLAPHDATIYMERAAHLARLSKFEEALSAYDDASEVSAMTDGTALLAAATLCLEKLNDEDRAVAYAARALDRDPSLCRDIFQEEELWAKLYARPDFDAALRRAETRVDYS